MRLTPVAVGGGLHFSQVSAGGWHACGVTTSATTYCWGANGFGTLGDGTTTERHNPTLIAGAM
jgi:alpha-tubulin suppressor-like RCC1 family protein